MEDKQTGSCFHGPVGRKWGRGGDSLSLLQPGDPLTLGLCGRFTFYFRDHCIIQWMQLMIRRPPQEQRGCVELWRCERRGGAGGVRCIGTAKSRAFNLHPQVLTSHSDWTRRVPLNASPGTHAEPTRWGWVVQFAVFRLVPRYVNAQWSDIIPGVWLNLLWWCLKAKAKNIFMSL